MKFCFYRPQTKLRKRNILTRVCQEFCPQGGGMHPLGRYPPTGRHPPGQTPLGKHPLGRDPQADTPWANTPSEMDTAVGSTYPTGMHSCTV